MTELSLPKKPSKHAIGGKIVFSCDIFGIERMMETNLSAWVFFSYNINIDLLLRAQNFNI
jgi:hypothetical protein